MPSADDIAAIELGIRERLVLWVWYRNRAGGESEFLIQPLAIKVDSAQRRFLVCWNIEAAHLSRLLWEGILGAGTEDDGLSRPSRLAEP
jgi:hypothetical protein